MTINWRSIAYASVGVGGMALVLLVVFGIARLNSLADDNKDLAQAIRNTQTEGSPLLKAISSQQDDIERGTDAAVSSNEQLLDCLQPEGQCFKDSQRRSADTVASVNEVSVYAAYCADREGEQTVSEIQQCIIERLAKRDRVEP